MRLRLLSAIATTVAVTLPASASAGTAAINYTTPGTYTFKVPAGVTSLSFRAVGASGSPAGIPESPVPGGQGGELSGTLTVTPGTVLRIAVDVGGGSGAGLGGRGGGYSGILTSSGAAIAIAPGGGGAGHNLVGESGGEGGDATRAGARGPDLNADPMLPGYVSGGGGGGGAGTSTAGGAGGGAGHGGAAGSAGGLLQGGAGAAAGASPTDDGSGGGGGGGGYYGGGGGGSTGGITVGGGGGGGGSFFVGGVYVSTLTTTSSRASVRLSFLDSTPPSLTLNAPQAVNPTTLTGTAGIEAGDNSTIVLDFISASQPTVTVQGSVSQTDGAFSVAVPSLARGAWLVRAVQRDSAGNETRTALRSFNRVDTPTITWPTPDPITYGTALSDTQLNATASVDGEFSYSPDVDTVLDAGADQDLEVTFTPDDTDNYAVTTKTVKLTVNRAQQTITFPLPDGVFLDSAPLTLTASATSGGPVTFSLEFGPCTLADTTLTINGVTGTCEIHATQAGTSNYEPATVIGLLYIQKLRQMITFPRPADGRVGDDPVEISFSSDSGLPVQLDVFGGCTVSGKLLTFTAVGICRLRARQGGTSQYEPALLVAHEITVTKGTPKITWPTPDPITYGTALSETQLNATASVDGEFSYSPDLDAVLDAGADQDLEVTFTPDDTDNYEQTSKTVKLTVNKASQEIAFDQPADAAFGDDPVDLSATASSDLDVAFSATGPCSISGIQLSFTGAGECTITASQDGDDNYLAAEAVERTITVEKGVVKVKWPTPAAITYGEALSSTQLNASAPIPGTFAYTPDAGTVLDAGSDRELTVTFTPEDGDKYETVELANSIDVERAQQEITFAQPADMVAGGEPQALTASASSKLAVAFAVTGPCTVAGGKVSATAAGSCQITATQPGDDNYLAAEPVVRTLTVAPKPVSPTEQPVPQAEPVALLGATLGQRCVVGRQRTTTALKLNLRATGAPKLTFRLDRKRGSRGRTRCPKANANYVAENRWATASVESAGTGELVTGTAARATARRATATTATATATLPANLKPGRYRLTITATAGAKSTSIPLYLWVLTPKKR